MYYRYMKLNHLYYRLQVQTKLLPKLILCLNDLINLKFLNCHLNLKYLSYLKYHLCLKHLMYHLNLKFLSCH